MGEVRNKLHYQSPPRAPTNDRGGEGIATVMAANLVAFVIGVLLLAF